MISSAHMGISISLVTTAAAARRTAAAMMRYSIFFCLRVSLIFISDKYRAVGLYFLHYFDRFLQDVVESCIVRIEDHLLSHEINGTGINTVKLLNRHKVDSVTIGTDQDYVKGLMALFGSR